MIYQPVLDDISEIILANIRMLGMAYGYNESIEILQSLGKTAIHYVLRTMEHPDYDDHHWLPMYQRCMRLLKWYAEKDMMSMSELQRYRQIITSEKK